MAVDPRAAQALMVLAVDAGARGDSAAAVQLLARARAADPRNPEIAFREGLAQRACGQEAAAVACFDAALQLAPGHPAVLNARGLALKALDRLDEALAAYDEALARMPRFAEALNNRGVVLRLMGRLGDAATSLRQAAAAQPGAAEIHNNLGWTLHLLGRHEEALAAYARALQLRPGDSRVLSNQSATLQALLRFDEAVAVLEDALRSDPSAWESWMNLGAARCGQKRPQDALAALERAERLAPGAPDIALNRGNALLDLARYDEALAEFEKVRAARGEDAGLLMNIGNAWRELQRNDLAWPCYERAVALAPGNADIHFNYALSLLAGGDYERGWQEHEWRWQAPGLGVPARCLEVPLWAGQQEVARRTVLLHSEQGLGDTLLMCRYAPLLAEREARVLLQVQKPLVALLRAGLPQVEVFGPDDALPPFDLHCPTMSLPLAFGTTLATVPAKVPYLEVPAQSRERWRNALPARELHVGLAWSGNPGHHGDRRRSMDLATLLPALPDGPRYWCLQKEMAPADRDVMRASGKIEAFEDNNFPDTAAQAVCMDVVVSVDTSIAQLACALACPTWILLAFSADHRWLTGRTDSPWNPTARLLRQAAPGDWSVPLQQVRAGLEALLARRAHA